MSAEQRPADDHEGDGTAHHPGRPDERSDLPPTPPSDEPDMPAGAPALGPWPGGA